MSINLIWGIPTLYFLYFVLALLVCLIGYYRIVWFVSVGYGLSIALMGIISLIIFTGDLTWTATLHSVVLIIYGLRLGTFLLYRDFKTSYGKDDEESKRANNIGSIGVKVAIWITVSLLYTTMFAPSLFHLIYSSISDYSQLLPIIGILISLVGVLIEGTADLQKNGAKKKAPNSFVSSGLFKIVRQPNYFGEILVWTGSFIAAIPFYHFISSWIIAIAGYLCIFLIMLGSAKRLELKQERRYGELDDFQLYSKNTPLLFPLIPIYSLKRWKIVLG